MPGGFIPGLAIAAGEPVVSVRPEDIRLGRPGKRPIRGRVSFVRDLGASVETYVACGEAEVVAVCTPRDRPRVARRRGGRRPHQSRRIAWC